MLVFQPEPRATSSPERPQFARRSSYAPLASAHRACLSLRWTVGAVALLCLLEGFTVIAHAANELRQGSNLAKARVLALPTAERIAAAESEWMQLSVLLHAKGENEGAVQNLGAGESTVWLREFIQRCNDEQVSSGGHAHFELVTPQGKEFPVLQLEWTSN